MNSSTALRVSLHAVAIVAVLGLARYWVDGRQAPRPGPQARVEDPADPIEKIGQPGVVEPADPIGPTQFVTAVDPKPLSDQVKKGLTYLINQQHANGGWGQGGGWRTADQGGGRVEGAQVSDPPDVGNTCIAVLALIRAGNTPTEGPYARNVARGIEFICASIEKSDGASLYVTDIRSTQLQSKIGQFVDTFLSTMVLAELKGRAGDKLEARLSAALNKTIAKIEKNQRDDGHFAGNHGWASVLSQGLANKGLNRAAQNGAVVSEKVLKREEARLVASFDDRAGGFRSAGPDMAGDLKARASAGRPAIAAEAAAAAPSDAGVAIYNASANVAGLNDQALTLQLDKKRAKEILANNNAPAPAREQARRDLDRIEKVEQTAQQATAAVVRQLENKDFVAGFGNNGGEEFLSFMNISETLLLKGGDDWKKWDTQITDSLNRVQDKDGSWSGHHCITGKTFCTAGALLVLMADRMPLPATAKK
jgi:hypothetical protein